jgi:hypothetical protein
MQLLDGQLVLSAADLTGFGACGHRSALDRLVAVGELDRPTFGDPFGRLLGHEGIRHDEWYLTQLRERRGVTEIAIGEQTTDGLAKAEADTLRAAQAGTP